MTITIDDELSVWLAEEASRRGQKVDEVAAQLLRNSIKNTPADPPAIRSVMDFAGVGAGRPGALRKDATQYIDGQRAEWEDRERQWGR